MVMRWDKKGQKSFYIFLWKSSHSSHSRQMAQNIDFFPSQHRGKELNTSAYQIYFCNKFKYKYRMSI